jgi:hypothetical protein
MDSALRAGLRLSKLHPWLRKRRIPAPLLVPGDFVTPLHPGYK